MYAGESHSGSIRILLIDDDLQMQWVVETLLSQTRDIELVGKGIDGLDALALCEKLLPDVLLLDIMMPVMNGFEAAGLLRGRFPELKILVLSNVHDHESVQMMLQNKVDGYVSKCEVFRNLAATIRTTYSGEMVFSRDVFSSHLGGDSGENQANDFGLTKREKEVLKLIAAGSSMGEIACQLGIGQTTVRYHNENIIRKFGVETRAQALVLAAKNKLIG